MALYGWPRDTRAHGGAQWSSLAAWLRANAASYGGTVEGFARALSLSAEALDRLEVYEKVIGPLNAVVVVGEGEEERG